MRIAKLAGGVILGVLLVLTICSAVTSGDFRISRVVKLGRGDMVPLMGPIKWSPDGTRLSYFAAGYLMESDTLGNARQILKITMMPLKYEWLNDDEIIVAFRKVSDSGTIEDRLTAINVTTAQERIIDSVTARRIDLARGIARWLNGPRLTVNGRVYYDEELGQKKTTRVSSEKAASAQQTSSVADDRILRWGDDALYLVRADLKDSTRLVDKPQGIGLLPATMNSAGTLVAEGGRIWSLTGAPQIVLDTFPVPRPELSVVCGFSEPKFNPTQPMVIYDHSCDIGEDSIAFRVAVFNYAQGTLTVLDPILGLHNCNSPRWSPDGLKFCFLANGNAYIAYWEE